MIHPRLVLNCACGRQLSCPACGDPAFLVQHKERLCSDAKQMQYRRFQGEVVHSIASESTPDSTHMTWPHHTGTVSDTASQDDAAFDLLGMLVAVVDDVACDFVYGPPGTLGRPDGVMDIPFLSSMATGHLLSADSHIRWLQFLHVWQNAGWSLQALLQVTDELRPWQYGSDLEMAVLASVQAAQLDSCIVKYCDQEEETHARISGFLAVVQRHFLHRNAVLMPAEDAFERLSMIELT